MDGAVDPIGAILAGGLGRRMGGAKVCAELGGRPLLAYPLAALRSALSEVAIVAKADTRLPPDLGSVPVWIEPPEPRHPLAGILHALQAAAGRPVLVCAGDMPFVTPALARRILAAGGAGAREDAGTALAAGTARSREDAGSALVAGTAGSREAPAVVPICAGELQPLLALYRPAAAALLAPALAAQRPLREAVAALIPDLIDLEDPFAFENVNTPEDLARAAARLAVQT